MSSTARGLRRHGHTLTLIIIFFFNDTATTEIYTLSLHDALPISWPGSWRRATFSAAAPRTMRAPDRKSTRLNSSHVAISYAVFCLKKKKYIYLYWSCDCINKYVICCVCVVCRC